MRSIELNEKIIAEIGDSLLPLGMADKIIAEVKQNGENSRNKIASMLLEYLADGLKRQQKVVALIQDSISSNQ